MIYKFISAMFLGALFGLWKCGSKATDNKASGKNDIQTINPNDILFTTATLENALPDFEDLTDTTNFRFHEDEWRQIEFVSKEQRGSIDMEIAKIKEIYDNYSDTSGNYIGFKKVAVRELITHPLAIDFSKAWSYLTPERIKIHGVSLKNNPGQVRNGFSFTANNVDYYGQLDDDKKIKWLCIYSARGKESLKSSVSQLSKLLVDEKLYLVDWQKMKVFDETNIKTDFPDIGN